MKKLNYNPSNADHTLFFKHSSLGGVIVLLVYVDDIIITGNDEGEIKNLSNCLAQEFDVKTLGRLKYFLGIKVAHSSKGIFISQRKYITDLLTETGKSVCKPAKKPIDPNQKLLLHYLKGTPGKGVLLKRSGKVEVGMFIDADYAGSTINRRSTSGHLTFVGGNLVTWRRICELLWVKNLLDELQIPLFSPMKIYCDNKSAINLVHNPVQHDCTKHVEIDRHFHMLPQCDAVLCFTEVEIPNLFDIKLTEISWSSYFLSDYL
ncbi:unnamed protein product [Spirodela intermedia]|uniref:Reverse transcriptase Ty1/copia-type domain-containing protein n=1 Tax=Spirodela intermedia TaxID=51605 RepID=A0A7I8JP07_SPIIN|nr:unnamed protein product [Spirodela intermedia]CAA6671840.1 unnamed protein product [Spirodela intermedia]